MKNLEALRLKELEQVKNDLRAEQLSFQEAKKQW